MRRLAYPLATLAVVLAVVGATVIIWMEWNGAADLVFAHPLPLVGVASAVTGGVVASRVPTNSVGWLILGDRARHRSSSLRQTPMPISPP